MTGRKSDNYLRGDRTPAYVGRETGAAELQISTVTWDKWVKEGVLPPPCPALPAGTPRWRWEDVDRKLSGQAVPGSEEARSITTAELIERAKNFASSYRRKPRRKRYGEPDEE